MIITRDIIRDDATFNGYSKQDLCEFINYWKIELLNRGAKPGEKIGLSFDNTEIHYYALIFASFELGLKIVTLHRPNTEKEATSIKSNAFLPLDYFIYLAEYLLAPETSFGVRHFKAKSAQSIAFGPLYWKINKDTFRSKEETPIYAEPDMVAFYCTSSGTTGNPKLIGYTHKFLFNLSNHNCKELEYYSSDKMMHFSSLNHGGVITLLLPALMICKEHHFKTFEHGYDTVKSFVQECADKGITKIFFANGTQVGCFVASMQHNNIAMPNTTIYLLSFICPEWSSAIKNGYLKSILSPFGCSEICGPVFMPHMDIHNVDTFDPKFLGEPLSGFYDTRIVGDRIHTVVDGKEFVFDDIVDGFNFVSKTRLKKINDIDINPMDIVDLIPAMRYDYEIYADEVYNELYIITHKEGLVVDEVEKFYYGNVPVKVIHYPALHTTRISHKADSEKLKGIVERYRLTNRKDDV